MPCRQVSATVAAEEWEETVLSGMPAGLIRLAGQAADSGTELPEVPAARSGTPARAGLFSAPRRRPEAAVTTVLTVESTEGVAVVEVTELPMEEMVVERLVLMVKMMSRVLR